MGVFLVRIMFYRYMFGLGVEDFFVIGGFKPYHLRVHGMIFLY